MDYGTAVNLVKYGTVQPSEYDLTGFPVKTALLWSANDQLATIQDITWLISQLPKANVGVVHSRQIVNISELINNILSEIRKLKSLIRLSSYFKFENHMIFLYKKYLMRHMMYE